MLAGQTARLRRLVDDIAVVSRAAEGQLPLHPVPIAPNRLVTTAVQAARPGYDHRGVKLTTRFAPQLPSLTADPDRLAQVLAGLLSNALCHTPPGGQVTVSTEPAGPGVTITVTDTGDGIAARHLPHIFERFYRADTARDRVQGGSGIGLTIARALITAHGGALTAASDGDGTGASDGTRFTITLPAATNAPDVRRGAGAPRVSSASQPVRPGARPFAGSPRPGLHHRHPGVVQRQQGRLRPPGGGPVRA